MILLNQKYKLSKDDTRELEKDLSEAWGEEVRIIPAGYDLVCREESKTNQQLSTQKRTKSDLFMLSKEQLRLIKAGLEARDNHNARIINESMTINKALDDIYSDEAIIESCREEHKEILALVKKIDKILNDPWYKYINFEVPQEKEIKDKKNNYIVVGVDLNIDEAMQKLEDMKSLMLEINNIDISADKTSIKNKKMQDIKELLKEVDGIEIGSESIILNDDSYKPLSKDEYMEYMLETRRKMFEKRWRNISKGHDYIFLKDDNLYGDSFYSLNAINRKAVVDKVSLYEKK